MPILKVGILTVWGGKGFIISIKNISEQSLKHSLTEVTYLPLSVLMVPTTQKYPSSTERIQLNQ